MLNDLVLHRTPGLNFRNVLVLVVFTVFAVVHRREDLRWPAIALRWVVGLQFLVAVADRFGLLGPADGSLVAWGDFDTFIANTVMLSSFLPESLAPTLAVLATAGELVLGLLLVLGLFPRLAALGAALLSLSFAVSMTLTVPPQNQFTYSVFLLAAGMFLLATTED